MSKSTAEILVVRYVVKSESDTQSDQRDGLLIRTASGGVRLYRIWSDGLLLSEWVDIDSIRVTQQQEFRKINFEKIGKDGY